MRLYRFASANFSEGQVIIDAFNIVLLQVGSTLQSVPFFPLFSSPRRCDLVQVYAWSPLGKLLFL